MKYLQLENTSECLKLAECLIGSNCDDVMVDKYHLYELEGVRDTGRKENSSFHIREDDGCGYDCGVLILPIETLKVNPYKCCEHSIPSIIDRGTWGKEKRSKGLTMLSILATGGVKFELDFDRLCKGAKIITK